MAMDGGVKTFSYLNSRACAKGFVYFNQEVSRGQPRFDLLCVQAIAIQTFSKPSYPNFFDLRLRDRRVRCALQPLPATCPLTGD